MNYPLFVRCPKGLEYLLEEELKSLGLSITRISPQGVYGEATLSVLYHLCLWSRIANRVQLILFNGPANNEQTLYQLCHQFNWQTVFSVDKSIAIEFHGQSNQIRNTLFGAQIIKDAIVDYYRQAYGSRPSVDKKNPQIRLHAYLKNDQLTLSFDLTGYSLHQRGYRLEGGIAPIKENIAAAMLLRANWPQLAEKGYGLQDPFCGSGTLVIEAAMMAAQIAPGLLRQDQSFHHWEQHQNTLWEKIRSQAQECIKPFPFPLQGNDIDQKSITMAKANAERAKVLDLVRFNQLDCNQTRPYLPSGLLITNPPYGERLEDPLALIPLYEQLGTVLHTYYQNWQAAVLTSNPLLAKAIGLRASKHYKLNNGPIECKLYCLNDLSSNTLKGTMDSRLSAQGQMLFNRLAKNYKHLKKWANKNNISCYRLYDADLPEYAYAIDLYNDYAVLQEYKAPASIPAHKVEQHSLEVMQIVPKVLGCLPDHLVVKQRQQQKGSNQYQKLAHTQQHLVVTEGSAKFKVNLYDYLDTGLFLDHRLMRLQFAKLSAGIRFLNCFCYTATASVHAALAGAITTNVDLSNTYLSWAKDNFLLNRIDPKKHQFIQQDCREWLKHTRERFDVIFLDPPSFSNSKRMTDTLDIQRDHTVLIRNAMRLLNPAGILYFSTNNRTFKLDDQIQEHYAVQNISARTIDQDFKCNQKIHQCFQIMSNQFISMEH